MSAIGEPACSDTLAIRTLSWWSSTAEFCASRRCRASKRSPRAIRRWRLRREREEHHPLARTRARAWH
jgi:hypothetical protein